jgi:CheY-like chemotaxis protein/HPt (histidine-containing phosphotransfer) domain-containing protein
MPYGRVLIVDDTEANLYVAKLMMDPYGLNIDTASSGYEAIEKIEKGNSYDIIFMDHMMPKMDGIEAVKIIRSLGYTEPIIALTANAVVGQADIFLTKGFDDFVSKPIDMRILDMMLDKYIYDKHPDEVAAAAQAEKEETDGQVNARQSANAEHSLSVSPGDADTQSADRMSKDRMSSDTPPFDIPGLNVGRGLAVFDDEQDTYTAALRSFTTNVPEIIDKLRAVTEENLPEYAINVHALKSVSGWICADGIQARAAGLEALAKAGNFVGVTTLNKSLIDETETFMSNLCAQLADYQ